MLAALMITLREGLEAALVVGIVLSVLRKLGRADRGRVVWAGVVAAVIVSLAFGLGLNALGIAFEGRWEEVFEGIAMLLAAGVLTWMVLWMQHQGRQVQLGLEREAREAVAGNDARMLFGLSFVAVVREGIETALFLTAAAFRATTGQTLIGGALGLFGAVALGWIVFVGGRQLDVRAFFRATGFLLILFAAGLLAHGLHELQEAALLPIIVEHVWDINPILSERSVVGSLLKALFGYNGNPSLLEVVSYVGYFAAIWMVGQRNRRTSARIASAAP